MKTKERLAPAITEDTIREDLTSAIKNYSWENLMSLSEDNLNKMDVSTMPHYEKFETIISFIRTTVVAIEKKIKKAAKSLEVYLGFVQMRNHQRNYLQNFLINFLDNVLNKLHQMESLAIQKAINTFYDGGYETNFE